MCKGSLKTDPLREYPWLLYKAFSGRCEILCLSDSLVLRGFSVLVWCGLGRVSKLTLWGAGIFGAVGFGVTAVEMQKLRISCLCRDCNRHANYP